ncbi:hypothetical protein GJW-30_1_02593 [Variibacter gotjawalensis]|uniref:Uncharacterized protein n=1 Tax=Variibacter gotjawalensis TaxID=1333996 RepID=A0A0S3PVU5_9BRAD|nr:hypothetical protein [Variibacter gotjawalensis]NIK45882.1 hypothetical protein [Variibacter gotjawalensis]RZS47804.1 hypothetical protein EV661_0197 [Variibacter gotjawalensis]BAT60058.1 hypothetical protein GJW-30_1_02593 [Variibacter gotjawalensis]
MTTDPVRLASLGRTLAFAFCLSAAFAFQTALAIGARASFERQIQGTLAAILETIIAGEFAGRDPSQVGLTMQRPVCRADDFQELVASPNSLDLINRRCRFVATAALGKGQAKADVFLPKGRCEAIKQLFERVISSAAQAGSRVLNFTHKGESLKTTKGDLLKGSEIVAACDVDALTVLVNRAHQKSTSNILLLA